MVPSLLHVAIPYAIRGNSKSRYVPEDTLFQCQKTRKRMKKYQKGEKCKQKYGKLLAKTAEIVPWKCVCTNLIGPYTLKGKDGSVLDFMCLIMIDPVTAWFEIVKLPNPG